MDEDRALAVPHAEGICAAVIGEAAPSGRGLWLHEG